MTPSKIGPFVLVGLIGFTLDAGITEVLTIAGLDPFTARLAALAMAVSSTFLLNRRFTFRSDAKGRDRLTEFGRYVLANGAALTVNYGVFAFVVATEPTMRPALAVGVGSVVAMAVSFVTYARFVFRSGR